MASWLLVARGLLFSLSSFGGGFESKLCTGLVCELCWAAIRFGEKKRIESDHRRVLEVYADLKGQKGETGQGFGQANRFLSLGRLYLSVLRSAS